MGGRVGRSAVALTLLLLWLAIRAFSAGETLSARNYLLILAGLLILGYANLTYMGILHTASIATRTLTLASVAILGLWPEWYINRQSSFVDSGKIWATVPNATGILGHANYSGLLLSAAITLELVYGIPRHKKLSLGFLTVQALLLLETQARNSIIAAIIATLAFSIHKRIPQIAGGLGLTCVALSTYPASVVLYDTLVNRPLVIPFTSSLDNRDTLWAATGRVISGNLGIGSGPGFIAWTHDAVQSSAVTEVVHAHNQWLQWLGEGGLPAALLGCIFSIVISCGATRCKQGPASLMLLIVLGVGMFAETPLTAFPGKIGVGLFLLLTILIDSSGNSFPITNADATASRKGPSA